MKRVRRRNTGLRKRCGCLRKVWPKCPHAWHFNYKPRGGTHYRVCLDREINRRIENKTEAEKEAAKIRLAIDGGSFRAPPSPQTPSSALTFGAFADIWKQQRGNDLVSAPIDAYRLKTIEAFTLPGTQPPIAFGKKLLDAITIEDVEAFRNARKTKGLSAVSINHDLRLLRKMFNWAIRKGYVARTPFKIGTEAAVSLEREIPRHKRFAAPDVEDKLLAASDPYLRAVVTAMLDTACRPGEILSLQWGDVSLTRRELTIRAEKEKTRRERIVPISSRLLAILELRQHDLDGRKLPADAYVFGDEIGRSVKSALVRAAWIKAATAAGLVDFQLRDLRHEAGSRFDEAGMPILYVSKMLGHSNLTTTSRYLNINRRGLHLAMQQFEKHQTMSAKGTDGQRSSESVAQPLHNTDESSLAVVRESRQTEPAKSLPS